MNKYTNFDLKLKALLFMLMDHIQCFLSGSGDMYIPLWFRYIGRLAAPIFFYMLVEGFFHTKNRKHYFLRLFVMGMLMLYIDSKLHIYNNIFLSLACGVAIMSTLEIIKNNKENPSKLILGILAFVPLSLVMIFTEASIYGLGMVLIFYFTRNNKYTMSISYIIFSLYWLISCIGPEFIKNAFILKFQWMMVFAIIPIFMYNGKRGFSNKYVQWMFYIFYPAHIILLVSFSRFLSQGNL